MRSSTPFYLLFFLFFLATAAGAEACASVPAALPDLAPTHACCAVVDEEGKSPADNTPAWSVNLDCQGDLCCFNHSASPPVAAAIRTVVNDQLLLPQRVEVLLYAWSSPPVVVSAPDKPPLSPFAPLYLRNCAFLI